MRPLSREADLSKNWPHYSIIVIRCLDTIRPPLYLAPPHRPTVGFHPIAKARPIAYRFFVAEFRGWIVILSASD